MSLWSENLPKENKAASGDKLVEADKKIDSMTADTNKLHFEADALALARDAAQLARLHAETTKSERAARVARVCHLRQENQIGSNLVSKHMLESCHHRAGPVGELHTEISKAWGRVSVLKLAVDLPENVQQMPTS